MHIKVTLQKILFNLGFLLLIIAFGMTFYSNGTGEKELPHTVMIYLCGFAATLLYFLFDSRKEQKLATNKFLVWFFILYLAWLLIEPYFSHWFDMSRQTTFLLFLTPVSFFISSYMTPTKLQKKILAIAYIGFGMFLFSWSVLHFVVTKERPDGPFTDANVFAGVLLVFLVPVLVYWLLLNRDNRFKSKMHDYLFLYILIGVIAFFCAFSRSATGALLIVGSLILIKLYIEFKPISTRRLLLLLAVFIGSYTLISNYQNQRNLTDIKLPYRLMIWNSGYEIYKDNKSLAGLGFGQFSSFYKRYRSPDEIISTGSHAHNDYLEFLIEGGVIQLGFFIFLSIYIILNYYKLLITRFNAENRIDKMKLFVALNLCCIFFIQANVNFIFYVATIATVIGALLGYFNRHALAVNMEKDLKNKTGALILVLTVIGMFMMLLYLKSMKFYITEPRRNSEPVNISMLKEANTLSQLLPRSLGINHFKLKYKLHEFSTNHELKISDEDHSLIKSELMKAKRNKHNDQHLLSFLAKYSSENPEISVQLAKDKSKENLFNLSSEELYLLSQELDPSLMANYYELRYLYLKNNENIKAYNLIKEKLHPTPVFAQLHPYNKNKVLKWLLGDAIKLGFVADSQQFANEMLLLNACYMPALEILNRVMPEECN